jgi:drug/metabolite transporter (DMT)-like permease
VSRSLKAHFLLVFITFVWGATFVVIKNALQDITPLMFNALRMSLAGVLLVSFYWKHLRHIGLPQLRSGLLVGTFLWLGYEFQTSGLRFTTPSRSGFLTGISVVLVPVFLALFWRRKVNRWSALGVTSALIGLFLMTVPAGEQGWMDLSSINIGDILTLGCAIAFAFHIIFLGRVTRQHRFEQMAILQTVFAALLMLLTIPVAERPSISWSPQVLWAIAITGVLCTAVAFTVQAWAQQFTPPTHTALIFALEPVFAWLTSLVLLGERLGWRAGAGALLILAGVLVSELLGRVIEPASELAVECAN